MKIELMTNEKLTEELQKAKQHIHDLEHEAYELWELVEIMQNKLTDNQVSRCFAEFRFRREDKAHLIKYVKLALASKSGRKL